MKRALLFFLIISSSAFSQSNYIFTATDVDGVVHNTQDYFDQGKPVMIMSFVDYWGVYWSIHEEGGIVDLYNTLGQGGTGEVVILYIAGFGFDTEAEIYDVDYSSDLGTGYENVDLTAGHDIPVIVATNNPEVNANPKGEWVWLCPEDGFAYLFGTILTSEDMLANLYSQFSMEKSRS